MSPSAQMCEKNHPKLMTTVAMTATLDTHISACARFGFNKKFRVLNPL